MGLARAWSVALHGGRRAPGRDRGRRRRRAARRCTSSACRTPRCTRRRTGCGRPSSTPGVAWPNERIVLALSPATLRKAGSGFDLALACAVLAADGTLAAARAGRHGAAGRAGARRAAAAGPRRAAVPARRARRGCRAGWSCPRQALAEAALVDGLEVLRRGDARPRCWRWLAGGAGCWRGPARRRPGREPQPLPTSPTSSGRTTPGGRWRSPRRVGTTCCWSGRPARARRCWPSGSSGCCPSSRRTRRWRSPRSAPSPGGCPAGGLTTHAAVRRAAPLHVDGGAGRRGQRARRARRGVARAPRRAVHRRGARVRAPHVLDALRTPLEEGEVRLSRAEGTVRLSRPGSSSCSRRTRARARPRTTATACARPSSAAATSGACPGRCSTASTCARACTRSPPWPWSRSRREDTATVRGRVLAARAAAADAWDGVRLAVQRRGARSRAARPLRAAGPGGPAAGRRVADGELTARGADRALRVAWTVADLAGRTGRTASASSRRCSSAIGGRHEPGGRGAAGAGIPPAGGRAARARAPPPDRRRGAGGGGGPGAGGRRSGERRQGDRRPPRGRARRRRPRRRPRLRRPPPHPRRPGVAALGVHGAGERRPRPTRHAGWRTSRRGEPPTRGACPPADHPSRLPAPPTQDAPASGQGAVVSGGVGSGQAPGGGVAGGLADREGAVNGAPPAGAAAAAGGGWPRGWPRGAVVAR